MKRHFGQGFCFLDYSYTTSELETPAKELLMFPRQPMKRLRLKTELSFTLLYLMDDGGGALTLSKHIGGTTENELHELER